MSSGYYLTPPFYYFNLGAHMLYILRNRLQAQNVKKAKQIKILVDICQAIFKQNFILSLLVPQDPFNIPMLKDIFTRLVHTSIMKLDQSSLDKLFYLMLMSVKKEIFLLSSPLQLYSLTLSHLLNLTKYLVQTEAVNNLQYAIQHFRKIASNYSCIQFIEIRQYMLSQLEVYQTKIVNFIQNQNQTTLGKLIFRIRNGHNQKSLGSAVNHKQIDFSNLIKPDNKLFYNDWKTWKTSLVIDFVKEYKMSSERRNSLTKQNQKKNQTKINKQKTLKDTLNLNNSELNDYQVTFDIFFSQHQVQGIQQNIQESLKSNKPKVLKKNQTNQNNNSYKKRIEKQFQDLKIQENEQQQTDLLQMMDN